jgi:hypothetical protein
LRSPPLARPRHGRNSSVALTGQQISGCPMHEVSWRHRKFLTAARDFVGRSSPARVERPDGSIGDRCRGGRRQPRCSGDADAGAEEQWGARRECGRGRGGWTTAGVRAQRASKEPMQICRKGGQRDRPARPPGCGKAGHRRALEENYDQACGRTPTTTGGGRKKTET